MRVDATDVIFSRYIKERDKWTCQRCKVKYKKGSRGLHCSHFFGRRMMSVRYEPDNCDSLCYGCHRYWEKEDREGYRAFKIKQLGQRRFVSLTVQARTPTKVDKKMARIFCKEELKKYE